MRNMIITLLIIIICSSSAFSQIAIVINPGNTMESLTSQELVDIYQGRMTQFEDGSEIHPFEYEPIVKLFYNTVLQKSVLKVRKNWLKLIFEGDYIVPPKNLISISKVEKELKEHPGAICFIPLEDVTEELKIISIDSLYPEDKRYSIPDNLEKGK